MAFRLGIDTGGTYTDAVLVDDQQQVVATYKSLTTRYDLTIGIDNALSGLPAEMMTDITLVSLSTTLTTNSVVEGQGAPVCVLLPGYNERQIAQSGLLDIVTDEGAVLLTGGHDANGDESEPLDEAAARNAILALKDKVSAFAISAMFGTRNTSHEVRLRTLVEELTGKPVACGHELASSLGAPQRALTAVLNARMVPYIQRLISSVKEILSHHQIVAPLMIVKGDGSLVNTDTALQQPVATVLSGPAASVVGACALSGLKNTIVADMGGTTTDIAIVSNGQPELCSEGARVGDWQPMVEAVRVYSVGLGGDSEIHYSTAEGIGIGPRRVVPMCLLGHQYPWVLERLEHQLNDYPNARNNRFVMRLEANEVLLNQLGEHERYAWERLADGPIELEAAVMEDRNLGRSLAKLQRAGLAIYSGFTPSDVAHVLGLSKHWSTDTANLAAKVWAKQLRNLYGMGKWELGDAKEPCREVYQLIVTKISTTLVEAGLHQAGKLSEARAQNLAGLLTELIFNSEQEPGAGALFNLDFAADYPLVAVGAPSASYYPVVADMLGTELILPEHGNVANAVGAVMGSVVQRAKVTISQPTYGAFSLYHKGEPKRFSNLQEAEHCAEQIVREEALKAALAAGAASVEVVISKEENHITHDIDGDLFLDSEVIATATGRPDCRALVLNAKGDSETSVDISHDVGTDLASASDASSRYNIH
ncbi:hydantoinase/oxoprolinase N-terminal domain-containing protein [Amphritea balenae]|uniref:Hydantoinase/oxoprolinase family protein n=1 Tax=Amphritea balenae TaxID=452629 RepID=A0A3P1SJ81_9GAMM|nr:hydantoinase/oxoprolinase family protein [Amphritea balenae]RRC97107.1 hydantoinase/oxoprolinase family protein [Amphritea balenae]GGK68069.1 hydantoinase [Amphritea balenae]